jgi:EAL domain-containing protein (putative c-di-GMP-specific phosphodiesterase class I)/DNA-binding response OmpR family regulator
VISKNSNQPSAGTIPLPAFLELKMAKPAILCVDDQNLVLKILYKQLTDRLGQDYDIHLAKDGETALSILAQLHLAGVNTPLVIADQIMPGISGEQLLAKVHTQYPSVIKILLATQLETAAIADLSQAGILYCCIAKPWNEVELGQIVKEALQRYYSQPAAPVDQTNLKQTALEQDPAQEGNKNDSKPIDAIASSGNNAALSVASQSPPAAQYLRLAQDLDLDHDLKRALEHHEFVLYYQPQLDITTEKIVQMEVIVLWQHPKVGLIPPLIFLPLAEQNGFILPLGEWVMQQACQQQKNWQQSGFSTLKSAIKLSPVQLHGHEFTDSSQFLDAAEQILQQTQLSPQSIQLVITEDTILQDARLSQLLLNHLRQMGFSLALGISGARDAGLNMLSMNVLDQFPVDTLQLDAQFVQNLLADPSQRAICYQVIVRGQQLKLKIVAQGVETTQQKDALKTLGCQSVQGSLLSPPLTAQAANELLEKQGLLGRISSIGLKYISLS